MTRAVAGKTLAIRIPCKRESLKNRTKITKNRKIRDAPDEYTVSCDPNGKDLMKKRAYLDRERDTEKNLINRLVYKTTSAVDVVAMRRGRRKTLMRKNDNSANDCLSLEPKCNVSESGSQLTAAAEKYRASRRAKKFFLIKDSKSKKR